MAEDKDDKDEDEEIITDDESVGGNVGSPPQGPGIEMKKKPLPMGEKARPGGMPMSMGEAVANSRWDDSLAMAKYIATTHGVRAPKEAIERTAQEILEWADANRIISIKANEATILPIFYEALLDNFYTR